MVSDGLGLGVGVGLPVGEGDASGLEEAGVCVGVGVGEGSGGEEEVTGGGVVPPADGEASVEELGAGLTITVGGVVSSALADC